MIWIPDSNYRYASRTLTAADMRMITAKSKLFKAIDFTIGLFKRLQKVKPEWGAFDLVIPELIKFRNLAQKRNISYTGQTMTQTLNRAYASGQSLLRVAEQFEAKLMISNDDANYFFKELPNKEKEAVSKQSAALDKLIADTLTVPVTEVPSLLMSDKGFFDESYEIVLPFMQEAESAVRGHLRVGDVKSRLKKADSTFGKQARKKKHFTMLTDLVGAMIVTEDIEGLGYTTRIVQSNFPVLNKENYFMSHSTYYAAVNYTVLGESIITEIQVKSEINYVSQMVSHDLIYAPEKAIASLTNDERKLVEIVCGAIKTMSLDEIIDSISA